MEAVYSVLDEKKVEQSQVHVRISLSLWISDVLIKVSYLLKVHSIDVHPHFEAEKVVT